MALYGGGLDPRKAGPRRIRHTQRPANNPQTGGMSAPQPKPRAGLPKAPGPDSQSLKALYMQKKRRRG